MEAFELLARERERIGSASFSSQKTMQANGKYPFTLGVIAIVLVDQQSSLMASAAATTTMELEVATLQSDGIYHGNQGDESTVVVVASSVR